MTYTVRTFAFRYTTHKEQARSAREGLEWSGTCERLYANAYEQAAKDVRRALHEDVL